MKDSSLVLTQATTKLLRPLVRLLLRNGIAFDALSELLKKLYVEVAENEFVISGKKQSVSRISTLTGLNRKEVSRARTLETLDLSDMTQQYNRAARVISGWVRDPDFQNSSGKPALLNLEEGSKSFKELVKRYSGDIPAGAIADELLRVGAVEISKTNKVKLLQSAYIPNTSLNEKIRILGTDVSDLIETIDHNIFTGTDQPYFQRKVAYDSIPGARVEGLRKALAKKAQVSLEDLDKLLAKNDTDSNVEITEEGTHRLGIGIYYFEERTNRNDS